MDVLIVDDDPALGPALADYLREEGYATRIVRTLADARSAVVNRHPDVLLIDLFLPDGNGLELLNELGRAKIQVVVITGQPSLDTAIEGLRAHVADYLIKPVDPARLKACLMTLGGIVSTDAEADLALLENPQALQGRSSAMRKVLELIDKVAPTEATVLLQGESGTGKEVAAQEIHRRSLRAKGPFLALNCGAVPENLIANELFGHERGGFTGANKLHKGYFERATGGTLFLDEITEMPLELQVNLLRVLETGKLTRLGGDKEVEVDVRVLAATNRDPSMAIQEGHLREDLYYRLCVFPVHMPPLCERGGDVLLLARYFLAQHNRSAGTRKGLTDAAQEHIVQYSWPGNVRELKNAIQRAFILAGDGDVDHDQLDLGLTQADTMELKPPVGLSLINAERDLVYATLERFDGDKKLAAKSLGISLKTLYNKLRRYGDPDMLKDG